MKKAKLLIAVLAAAVGLVAACSSGGTDSGAPAAPASTLTGDPIVVGFICSCSGAAAAAAAPARDSISAWEKWTNAHAGVNGHPVKVIIEDDAGDPSTALTATKKLVEQDHVMAIVGQDSLVDATWASYIESTGVPVVGGTPLESTYLTNPDFYASGSSQPVQSVGMIQLVKQKGLHRLGVLYCAEHPLCAQLPQISELGSTLNGSSVAVQSEKVAATTPNFAAQCLALKNANVDALTIGTTAPVAVRVASQCAQMGYKPADYNYTGGFATSWLKEPNLDGTTLVSPNANFRDPSVPGVKDFLDALATYAPKLPKSDQFTYPSFYPWAGGQLFVAAAKAANLSPTSTAADVKKGLYALKDETLNGIAPPLNFTPGKPALPTCYFTMEIKNGDLASLNNGNYTCLSTEQAHGLVDGLKTLGG